MPAYWVALTVVVAVYTNGVTSHNAWIYYGFGQIYSDKTYVGGLGPAWTLCIEVTFYAALPLFALAAARLSSHTRSIRADLILLAVLAAISFAVHALFYGDPTQGWVAGTLPGTFYWFALGMMLALLTVAEQHQPRPSAIGRAVTKWPTVSWLVGAGVFVLLCTQLSHPNGGTGSLSEFILYGMVSLFVLLPGVFGDDAAGSARRVLRLRVLSWIGLVSYGFYLYHAYVIKWMTDWTAAHGVSHGYLFVLATSFVGTCVIAAASYYLLERPILQLKNLPLATAVRTEFTRLRNLRLLRRPRWPPNQRSRVHPKD